MSNTSYSGATRAVGRNTLDLPLAALAALAFAFLTFTIPAEQLARLVGSTGLPNFLEAAAPPLGMKARIGLGAVGALTIFALVFALLRMVDRKPRSNAHIPLAPMPETEEAPRLRRRDFHPDAPSRRPISAARDLGEPDEDSPDEVDAPIWLAPAQPEEAAMGDVEADEGELFGSDPEEPVELELSVEAARVDQPEMDQPVAEVSLPMAEVRPAQSIGELMARLEQGLARRQAAVPVAVAVESPATDEVTSPDFGDHRLQSAIESLQRLAARQG